MIALVLEASTYVGSVAVIDGTRVLAERTVAMRGREHEALMPAVAKVLDDAGCEPAQLGRIVCGAGPGAFTSLRIAGGIAKGLALSLGRPLHAVGSLALLVASSPVDAGRYLAVVDAMRGEHYAQPFAVSMEGTIEALGGVTRIASGDVARTADTLGATAIGPGRSGHHAIDPHARGAARITNMIDSAGPADLASWEPAYGRLAEAQVKWEAEHGRPLVDS